MANLALFDLDHTLIPTDSDHEWGRFMVKHGMVDAENFARENDRFYADYKAGKLDIHAYLVAMLTPLAKYSRAQLAEYHQMYMHEVIKPTIVPVALELVRQHRDAGDLCCMVTATNEFITGPIAAVFGVDNRGRPAALGLHRPSHRHTQLQGRQDRPYRGVARFARQDMVGLRAQLFL
jgi:phosphoserine phosphatase